MSRDPRPRLLTRPDPVDCQLPTSTPGAFVSSLARFGGGGLVLLRREVFADAPQNRKYPGQPGCPSGCDGALMT